MNQTCENCDFSTLPVDGNHCYVFREKPLGSCAQWKEQRLLVGRDAIRSSLATARAEAIAECAALCDEVREKLRKKYHKSDGRISHLFGSRTAKELAAAIRALKDE